MVQSTGPALETQTYRVFVEATSQAVRVETMQFYFEMHEGVMYVRHGQQVIREFSLGSGRLGVTISQSGGPLPFTFQEQEDGTFALTGFIFNNKLYMLP